ncbi:MAG: DUF5615 family PIN-like protein [Chloroflexota bacterium]
MPVVRGRSGADTIARARLTLLFDENLSRRLVRRLADCFPGSTHVHDVGLTRGQDEAVWTYARDHDLAVVTKDADFADLAQLRGFPPYVVWLRLGNCTTDEIESALRRLSEAYAHLPPERDVGIIQLIRRAGPTRS